MQQFWVKNEFTCKKWVREQTFESPRVNILWDLSHLLKLMLHMFHIVTPENNKKLRFLIPAVFIPWINVETNTIKPSSGCCWSALTRSPPPPDSRFISVCARSTVLRRFPFIKNQPRNKTLTSGREKEQRDIRLIPEVGKHIGSSRTKLCVLKCIALYRHTHTQKYDPDRNNPSKADKP